MVVSAYFLLVQASEKNYTENSIKTAHRITTYVYDMGIVAFNGEERIEEIYFVPDILSTLVSGVPEGFRETAGHAMVVRLGLLRGRVLHYVRDLIVSIAEIIVLVSVLTASKVEELCDSGLVFQSST